VRSEKREVRSIKSTKKAPLKRPERKDPLPIILEREGKTLPLNSLEREGSLDTSAVIIFMEFFITSLY
jgi:hypothetical protein